MGDLGFVNFFVNYLQSTYLNNIGSLGSLVYSTYEFFKVPKMCITQGAAVLAALRLGLVLQLAHQ